MTHITLTTPSQIFVDNEKKQEEIIESIEQAIERKLYTLSHYEEPGMMTMWLTLAIPNSSTVFIDSVCKRYKHAGWDKVDWHAGGSPEEQYKKVLFRFSKSREEL